MRVLHVAPTYFPAVRYGGPIVSARALCRALTQAGLSVDVATTNADGPGDLQVPTDDWTEVDGLRVRYFARWPRVSFGPSAPLTAFLARSARDYDLIHISSTFSFPSAVAGWAARRAGVPYVVSPRGSLLRWSLTQKRWKKIPYWHLVERRHLEHAAALHATADNEEEDIHLVLPDSKVFVSPNGMETVEVPSAERHPRRLVFLGRLHVKKGLDILVEAASLLSAEFPDLEVVVAGPDDTGEQSRIEAILVNLSPRPLVRWIGSVTGAAKWELLASAGAFVLPSHSENFGMAVVEALACGTPVVVSRHTPWQVAQDRGAGFWIENTAASLAAAVRRLLVEPGLGERMGAAGKVLAAEYHWPAIGRQVAEVYRGLVAGGGGHGS